MTTTPTFSERTAAVSAMAKKIGLIAHDLRLFSDELAAEAERMQAAQKRFGFAHQARIKKGELTARLAHRY